MRKGWLYYSIIIGLAATLVAYTVLAMVSNIAARQGQLFNRLYQSGADPMAIHQYDVGNGLFVLGMIALFLLEFACGMLSFAFARSSDGKTDNRFKASLVAGMMPALAFGVFQLNSWRNSVSQNNTDTYMRPIDPLPDFFVIGLLVFLMAVCLMASLAGGWLTRVALYRETDDSSVTRKK